MEDDHIIKLIREGDTEEATELMLGEAVLEAAIAVAALQFFNGLVVGGIQRQIAKRMSDREAEELDVIGQTAIDLSRLASRFLKRIRLGGFGKLIMKIAKYFPSMFTFGRLTGRHAVDYIKSAFAKLKGPVTEADAMEEIAAFAKLMSSEEGKVFMSFVEIAKRDAATRRALMAYTRDQSDENKVLTLIAAIDAGWKA